MVQRLSFRWPVVLAAVFCGYSMVLVWNAFRTQEQLKAAADSRLIANSLRKATAVSDFVAERRNGVAALADVHEIETYLINKALGMSPRYGLNANLDAVEASFRRRIAPKSEPSEPIYRRIAFYDERGELLVDTAPGEPAIPLPNGGRDAPTLAVDPAGRRIIATAPVIYKGVFGGTIAAVAELEQLSRYLISSSAQEPYLEVLLTQDGRELPALGRPAALNAAYTSDLAKLPENKLVRVDPPLDGRSGRAARADRLAVRTPIAGMPLSLVTILAEDEIYGHITSRVFLFSATAFPLVVLLVAFLFDRMRRRTLTLQAAYAESDRRRYELQGRNVVLSEEIERREAVERELREKSGELEAMAADLRLSMLRAEGASLAKTRFLATVSHEIRTPMNGVLGMAQRLLLPELSEEERLGYARTILNSGQTLLTLMNDILDLSKAEAGKLELSCAAFDPRQIIDETAALFAEPARQKGLRMEAAWDGPKPGSYWGDPIRLRQMLSNLASNSIKFTGSGHIRIDGSEIERDAGEAVLEYRVSDSGIGVPEDKLSMLFQPFTQVDSSSTRKFGGTGLGLSIVRSLAQMMRGDVGVESKDGEGARFWFRVRVGIVKEAVGASWSEREPAAAGADGALAQAKGGLVLAWRRLPGSAEATTASTRGAGEAPGAIAQAPERPLDLALVVPLVQEIEVLLEGRKYKAVSRFQSLHELASGTDALEDIEAIGRLVADFRYDDALSRLRELVAARNWRRLQKRG